MTKLPSEEGNESSISAIYPRKMGLTLKNEFYVQNRSSRPKIDPHETKNFWDVSMRKEQQQPP